MIADIVIGFWVIVLTAAHINWRLKLSERLAELSATVGEVESTSKKDSEMRIPKSDNSEENYYRNVGYRGNRRDIEEIYFFFLPLSRVVKDLMNHTGMEYKYEGEKPEKIEVVKKPVARKRK